MNDNLARVTVLHGGSIFKKSKKIEKKNYRLRVRVWGNSDSKNKNIKITSKNYYKKEH